MEGGRSPGVKINRAWEAVFPKWVKAGGSGKNDNITLQNRKRAKRKKLTKNGQEL